MGRGGVGGGQGEKNDVRVAGFVGDVWVGAQGEGVEDAADVVFFDGAEEGFVRCGVVGEGC